MLSPWHLGLWCRETGQVVLQHRPFVLDEFHYPSRYLTCGTCCCQGDLSLNIAEAHAFNTMDRFSLDVFVVSGWTGQVDTHLRSLASATGSLGYCCRQIAMSAPYHSMSAGPGKSRAIDLAQSGLLTSSGDRQHIPIFGRFFVPVLGSQRQGQAVGSISCSPRCRLDTLQHNRNAKAVQPAPAQRLCLM